tara:strand:- start:1142 stop:1333 length:192 start_codon:yes stop_codon:yes gene_type:complete
MAFFSSVLIITGITTAYASLLKFCSRDPESPEYHHEQHSKKKDLSRFACKPWQNKKYKNNIIS